MILMSDIAEKRFSNYVVIDENVHDDGSYLMFVTIGVDCLKLTRKGFLE